MFKSMHNIITWRGVSELLGTLGVFFIGLASMLFAATYAHLIPWHQNRVHPWETAPKVEHSFELVQLGQFRRDQFLYDKRTGRVWQSSCVGKVNGPDCGGMMVWDEMYVDGVTPQDSPLSFLYNFYNQQQAKSEGKNRKKAR